MIPGSVHIPKDVQTTGRNPKADYENGYSMGAGAGIDFGNLSGNYNESSSVSNATRGVIYAGYPGTINIIDYIININIKSIFFNNQFCYWIIFVCKLIQINTFSILQSFEH